MRKYDIKEGLMQYCMKKCRKKETKTETPESLRGLCCEKGEFFRNCYYRLNFRD